MKFFIDNCLAPRLARALHDLVHPEHEVSHLRDKFAPDVRDIEWITMLGEEGDWVIVSGDTRIPKNPHNRAAWRESGLTGFFFKKGFTERRFWEQAWRVIRYWPTIMDAAKTFRRGTGFWVSPTGKLEPVKQR